MYSIDPIGYFQTKSQELYHTPSQPSSTISNSGVIALNNHSGFELALRGLEQFDLIWVIFRFHRHNSWKPMVLPPRGGKKQGVFATRSPHRPNFIGMSCVRLKAIEGLKIFIDNHDLIDQTPILDIKPYINYADSHISKQQGWLDEIPRQTPLTLQWSLQAKEQLEYLLQSWKCDLRVFIENRLVLSPYPYPSNRVKKMGDNTYQLAYKTWRFYYTIIDDVLMITQIASGYDKETLCGEKISKWDDVPIHRAFVSKFYLQNTDFAPL